MTETMFPYIWAFLGALWSIGAIRTRYRTTYSVGTLRGLGVCSSLFALLAVSSILLHFSEPGKLGQCIGWATVTVNYSIATWGFLSAAHLQRAHNSHLTNATTQ